jgi:hypothetical protein
MMIAITPAQVRAMSGWRDRHQQLLPENYPNQFIAFNSIEILAAGTDYQLVMSTAEATGQPFLIEWIPGLTANGWVEEWKFPSASCKTSSQSHLNLR